MKKLLELLNEYRTEQEEIELYEFEVSQTLDSLNYLRLFIKWLVDNDKIDESKIEIHWFSFYESVLMELSIQDNPIEFLVSILK